MGRSRLEVIEGLMGELGDGEANGLGYHVVELMALVRSGQEERASQIVAKVFELGRHVGKMEGKGCGLGR